MPVVRINGGTDWLRAALLHLAAALALLPLIAVLIKDLAFLPVFSALAAIALLLVFWGRAHDAAALRQAAPDEIAASDLAPGAPTSRTGGSKRSQQGVLILLHDLAALDNDIIRFCELTVPPPRGALAHPLVRDRDAGARRE